MRRCRRVRCSGWAAGGTARRAHGGRGAGAAAARWQQLGRMRGRHPVGPPPPARPRSRLLRPRLERAQRQRQRQRRRCRGRAAAHGAPLWAVAARRTLAWADANGTRRECAAAGCRARCDFGPLIAAGLPSRALAGAAPCSPAEAHTGARGRQARAPHSALAAWRAAAARRHGLRRVGGGGAAAAAGPARGVVGAGEGAGGRVVGGRQGWCPRMRPSCCQRAAAAPARRPPPARPQSACGQPPQHRTRRPAPAHGPSRPSYPPQDVRRWISGLEGQLAAHGGALLPASGAAAARWSDEVRAVTVSGGQPTLRRLL